MIRASAVFTLACWSACAAVPGAGQISRQIQEAGLDASECYRVIDLNFSKEDIRIYFTSGYLIFSKPVNGLRMGAMFAADVEGGDAELLLLPPVRSERLSLVNFIDSPNLSEHFQSALALFSDRTGQDLLAQLQARGAKKAPEMGALLADKWSGALKNVTASFQVRMVQDTLNAAPETGFFYMTASGQKLGNFDVFYDPLAPENIMVGQLADHKGQTFFDVWTSFRSRSRRGSDKPAETDLALDNFRIEATLNPDLNLNVVTRVTGTAGQRMGRAIPFSISQKMRVLEAKIDGQAVEVFQRESLRSSLINASGNDQFLVIAPGDLDPGKPHEFEFRHEGAVVSKAGDQVFYVGARGAWYPRSGSRFSRYDLTFRYPKDLGFVATGDVVEDRTEGDWRITRRKTALPIRFAGFNLGNYQSVSISHEPFKVEVYANRRLEAALVPKTSMQESMPAIPSWQRRRPAETLAASIPPPPPNPVARLQAVANDVAGALDFMTAQFGPPPIKTLTVSPIPGGFGQGFPGLVYLSTLAYLDPEQRPPAARDRFHQTFYSEMLEAHEVAHQWWGNLVFSSSYQDAWLMEALANYSALLFLEKKNGVRALETVLDDYRNHLLAKGSNGASLESAGPITWGYRLQSSITPEAWHYITYEKGAWVMHMLRRRLGDDQFLAMLRAMCKRYEYRAISTDQFRELAAEFAPHREADSGLSGFFENWVYGTGIPAVKMTYAVRGLKVTGTVTQTDVKDDFTERIPIEVQVGRQRTLYWVLTGNEPVPFSIPVKAQPSKVALAAKDALIVAKK